MPVPIYDYTHHTRSGEVRMVRPARIVVVEGILVLYEPQLRDRFDLKVYVDTDADLHAELVSLEYIGGNDEDAHEELEVYGNLKVSVPVEGGLGGCEEEGNHWLTLFDRGGEAPVSVQPFGPWQPPAPLFADAYAVPIAAASTLCFKARLYERDYGWFSDNDDFGEHVLGPIAFENGWSGDHIVQLVAEGGEIHATVRITLK